MVVRCTVLLLCCIGAALADVYFHNPRGSNNRLAESGRARSNGNRMFDSQNNDRGGYNVGSLYYYGGSKLPIEWTNQHSCDGPNNNCEIIIQYMCGPSIRDGITTRTIPENRAQCQNYNCDTDLRYGMHESYYEYMHCKYRQRDGGLFTADQNLKRQRARYTRQNPQGTRRGYECPEERDHYPYHHPTGWKDIVIMTNNVDRCENYTTESQNVKSRWACVPPTQYYYDNKRWSQPIPITKDECEQLTVTVDGVDTAAVWQEFPSHGIPAPDCIQSKWSRDNHLGNGRESIYPNTYDWILPNENMEHCAMRIRYNISTNDFDSWNTFDETPEQDLDISDLVGLSPADATQRGYVYKNNPEVSIFPNTNDKLKLRLAINTAQYGRTFQDRSHTFDVRRRPTEYDGKNIINVNVRGKRGNIVQVYPAVEYDFVPNVLSLSSGDVVHFQWTGSNTNPGNNDGQGLRGTDRSNAVLLRDAVTQPQDVHGHWRNSYPKHIDMTNFLGLSRDDLVNLALLRPGQFGGEMSELDDAGTYYDLGLRTITSPGTYYYMCTRNNNFSNRSQKGKIIIHANPVTRRQVGYSGGELMLDSGSKTVVVGRDTLKEAKTLIFEEWPSQRGDDYVKAQGGSMNAGDGYASNYYVLFPAEDLTKDGKTMTLKMEVDTNSVSNVALYHSYDTKIWSRFQDVDFDGSVATLQTSKGGFYVARKEPRYGVIAGLIVAGLVLAIVVIGTTIYCRKKPGRWDNFKRRTRNVGRTFKSTI